MAFNCLIKCGNRDIRGIKKTLIATGLMPWVEVWVGSDDGPKISVGNFSSRDQGAVIKSFQFGMSNGAGVNIEIVDEKGGNFWTFFQKITTGNAESPKKNLLKFRWGWATLGGKNDCNAGGRSFGEVGCPRASQEGETLMSRTHTMIVKNIVCNIDRGLFKFAIEGTDIILDLLSTRTNTYKGKDSSTVSLKQAITEMLAEHGLECKFLRRPIGCGKPEELSWLADYIVSPQQVGQARGQAGPTGSDKKGIPGRWNGLNRNPMQVARDWINQCITDKKKGVEFMMDTTSTKPTVVFYETNKPTCGELLDSKDFNLGTYVVNGGACSPVISFNPKIGFDYNMVAHGSGGYSGGAASSPMKRVENGPDPCIPGGSFPNLKNAGIQMTQQPSDIMLYNYGFFKALGFGSDKKLAHAHANMNAKPISAELRIQGDPVYSDPLLCIGFYITIVYINPHHVEKALDTCVWTTEPICNDVLTNANWMITGGFHEVREGSYTTTLQLRLAAPGIDIPRGQPLGADRNARTLP